MMKIALVAVVVITLLPMAAVASQPMNPQSARSLCETRIQSPQAEQYCEALLTGKPVEDYCAQPGAERTDGSMTPDCAAQRVAENVAGSRIGADQSSRAVSIYASGLPKEEAQIVLSKGIPCHVETYDGGPHYVQETFWYCDGDGSYQESFTFLNGHLKSHFVP